MPRCNLKRTLCSSFLIISTICVILSCRTNNWPTFGPWKVKTKEVKLVSRGKESLKNQTFLSKPVPKNVSLSVLRNGHYSSAVSQLIFSNSSFQCGKDGILTVKSGGRLGNLMGEYATLWALAKRDGFFPILQHRTHSTLIKYFLNTSIPSITNLNCSLKWKPMNLHVYNKLNKEERKNIARKGIFIDGYPTSVSLFHRHRKNIIQEFQFKQQLMERAQAELRRLRGNRQSVIYVILLFRYKSNQNVNFFLICKGWSSCPSNR